MSLMRSGCHDVFVMFLCSTYEIIIIVTFLVSTIRTNKKNNRVQFTYFHKYKGVIIGDQNILPVRTEKANILVPTYFGINNILKISQVSQ